MVDASYPFGNEEQSQVYRARLDVLSADYNLQMNRRKKWRMKREHSKFECAATETHAQEIPDD